MNIAHTYSPIMPYRCMQRGLVLFFALIALVVMSLAAVGLIRSVDTSNLIAGNLAFKQAATTSADYGVDTAISWLETTITANPATLDADAPASGYYATVNNIALTADATWTNAASRLASGTGISDGVDASGNTIRYVVERMCRNSALPADEKNCLFGAPPAGASSKAVKDITEAGAIVSGGKSLMFRVTARVTGPKDTVSYIQAFIY